MTIRPGFLRFVHFPSRFPRSLSPLSHGSIEYFKLHLDPVVLRDGRLASADLPELPIGKSASDVVTDFLGALWAYAKAKITEEIGSVADLGASLPFRLRLFLFLLPETDPLLSCRGRRCDLDRTCCLGCCRLWIDEGGGDRCGNGAGSEGRRSSLARPAEDHHVRLFLLLSFRYESSPTRTRQGGESC